MLGVAAFAATFAVLVLCKETTAPGTFLALVAAIVAVFLPDLYLLVL